MSKLSIREASDVIKGVRDSVRAAIGEESFASVFGADNSREHCLEILKAAGVAVKDGDPVEMVRKGMEEKAPKERKASKVKKVVVPELDAQARRLAGEWYESEECSEILEEMRRANEIMVKASEVMAHDVVKLRNMLRNHVAEELRVDPSRVQTEVTPNIAVAWVKA